MKELNGAKCYTPDTSFEFVQKCSRKLWNFIIEDEICGENPTLQQVSIYNRQHFTQIRNFGEKTMLELDKLLAIAGLEITNDSPIYTLL